MTTKKKRIEIPQSLRARVLFASDRTCCICRNKGKGTQIHHIDENPANNAFENLAVLCFDCHNETQVKGGFHSKLDADQVILYRDDWLVQVSKERAGHLDRLDEDDSGFDVELATSLAEIYRDREEYELLALHYLAIDNEELRDKYVELAIQQGMDDESIIFFRAKQDKIDLIPTEVIDRRVKALEVRNDWFGLGRLYRQLKQFPIAVQSTCKGVIKALDDGNIFTAAFHLKELYEDNALEPLFMIAFDQAQETNDLWWQFRSLQELDWHDEAISFLEDHKEEIEELDEPGFNEYLAIIEGDKKRYMELRKEEARSISAKLEFDDVSSEGE